MMRWNAALVTSAASQGLDADVLVIGAGMSGLGAVERLIESKITNFLLLEASDHIGGRVHAQRFGDPKLREGIVETGANWIHGTSERNPNWRLAERVGLRTKFLPGSCANVSGYSLYEADGRKATDAEKRAAAANAAYDCLNATAQSRDEDESAAAALSQCGLPPATALDRTLRWELTSANDEVSSEKQSLQWMIPDATYSWLGTDDHFVHDQRPLGYSAVAHEILNQAGLTLSDPRLLLNGTVERIDSSDCDAVRVQTRDGRVFRSRAVVSTLPLGVMQADKDSLFVPSLPQRQLHGLDKAVMGNFSKIFIQFPDAFWAAKGQQWLAAAELEDDPMEFHDIDALEPGFGVLFTYVTGKAAIAWEQLSDEAAAAKLMDRLRRLFPERALPEPTAFFMTRHGLDPLMRGAYSTFRVGWSDEDFEAMVAPVMSCGRPRVAFAGEHTCYEYNGYVHGAYWSGRDAASEVLSGLGLGLPNEVAACRDAGAQRPFTALV